MPEKDVSSTKAPQSKLEDYWLERFEVSANLDDDAARNIGKTYGHKVRRDVFKELAKQYLPSSTRSVLDIGCGSGTYFDLYDSLGLEIHGLDFSVAQLAQAQKRWPKAQLIEGELSAAPVDLKVDLIVCIGVVQVVSDLPAFIDGIAARINPGGRVIISCLNRLSVWPGALLDPQLNFYSKGDMRRLFGAKLNELEFRRFYPIPPPLSWMTPALHRIQLPFLNHGLMFVLEPKP